MKRYPKHLSLWTLPAWMAPALLLGAVLAYAGWLEAGGW